MKMLVQFMLILGLLSLVSCGAKKSSMTLKVTSSMAVTNSSFPGGLVFFGRSSDGKLFSAPAAFNNGHTSNQIQIELDQGQWTFSAVGWNSTAALFEGNTKCAVKTTTLNSADQTIDLDLTPLGCTNPAFGENVGADYNFKDFKLITCGTFYTNPNTNPPQVLTVDSPSFCENLSDLNADMKMYAKSARIFIPVITPGQTPNTVSPLSFCQDLTLANFGRLPTNKKFPAKGMPIQIELSKNECADTEKKIIASYPLLNGFDSTYSEYDHKYFNATTTNLYLLSSLSRRGTSSLLNSLPRFVCDDSSSALLTSPCIKIPSFSGANRAVSANIPFYVKDAKGSSCADLSASNGIEINNTAVTGWTCNEIDGKIFITLTSVASCTSSFCTLDINFTNNPIVLTIREPVNHDAVNAYDLIFNILGHEKDISAMSGDSLAGFNSLNRFNYKNEDEESFGLLSNVRELFSPGALGGLFYNLSSIDLRQKTVVISLWEDGFQKTYQIKAEANVGLMPSYIRFKTTAGTSSPDNNFSHKITISQILGGAYFPEQIISFKYGYKVGMSESFNVSEDDDSAGLNDRLRMEKNLLYWNTHNAENSRIEAYRYETETKVDSGGAEYIHSLRTSFSRAEHNSITTSKNDVRIDQYFFESIRNAGATSNFTERGTKSSVIMSGNKALYLNSFTEDQNYSHLTYFSNKTLENYRNSSSTNGIVASAKSPDGTKKIMAWAGFDGTNYDLNVVIKAEGSAAEIFKFSNNASNVFKPKVSINNNGEPIVAWVQQTSIHYGYAMTRVGDVWRDTTSAVVAANGSPASFHNSSVAFNAAVVDQSPTSINSAKNVVFHDGATNLKAINLNAGNWDQNVIILGNNQVFQPLTLDVVKNGVNYFVFYTYVNSANYFLAVDSTPDFATSSMASIGVATPMGTPPTVFATVDGTTTNFFTNHSNLITKWSSTSGSWPGAGEIDTDLVYETEKLPYCFVTSPTTSLELGLASVTDSCNIPDFSYADPIRPEFKFDIESLNPSTFDTMFTIEP